MKEEPKEDAGNPTEDSETSRSWNQNCEKDFSVEEEPEFKADLRVEGIAHDVILKDKERMDQIQEVVGKLRKGSYTKSIREDLRQPENSLMFSEESRRIIHELGSIELHELGQTSSTIQCQSCYKHMPEGLRFRICGILPPTRRRYSQKT